MGGGLLSGDAVEQERERARSVTEMCVGDDGQCYDYQKVILVVR